MLLEGFIATVLFGMRAWAYNPGDQGSRQRSCYGISTSQIISACRSRMRILSDCLLSWIGWESEHQHTICIFKDLNGVSGFDVDLRLWNSAEGFKMALATDLDEQFSARVKAVLGAELAKLQNELKAKVNGIIAEKRKEFEKIYNAKKAEAEARLAQYTAMVTEKVAMVDAKKKELEDQLEKAKKGKIDDAVRKLFKKP